MPVGDWIKKISFPIFSLEQFFFAYSLKFKREPEGCANRVVIKNMAGNAMHFFIWERLLRK